MLSLCAFRALCKFLITRLLISALLLRLGGVQSKFVANIVSLMPLFGGVARLARVVGVLLSPFCGPSLLRICCNKLNPNNCIGFNALNGFTAFILFSPFNAFKLPNALSPLNALSGLNALNPFNVFRALNAFKAFKPLTFSVSFARAAFSKKT